MNDILNKVLWAAGTAIVAVALCLTFFPKGTAQVFGSTGAGITNLTGLSIISLDGYTGLFDVSGVGTGTQFKRLNGGSCYFAPSATTIAASTTIAVDCQATQGWSASGESALTGVSNGDAVQMMLSTTTTRAGVANYGGLDVVGASASSTAGYITTLLYNQTGGTYTWPTTGTASGTASYWVNLQ